MEAILPEITEVAVDVIKDATEFIPSVRELEGGLTNHGQEAEERLRQPSEQEIQERLRQGTERMRFAMRGRNLPGEQPRHPLVQERSNVCDRLYPDGSGSLGAYDRLHQGVQERLREQDHSQLEMVRGRVVDDIITTKERWKEININNGLLAGGDVEAGAEEAGMMAAG